jgi:hypothetical protein
MKFAAPRLNPLRSFWRNFIGQARLLQGKKGRGFNDWGFRSVDLGFYKDLFSDLGRERKVDGRR